MPDHDDEMGHMAESDLRTMIEAEKIRKDPKRMKAMMKKHAEMMSHMKSMGGKGMDKEMSKDHG